MSEPKQLIGYISNHLQGVQSDKKCQLILRQDRSLQGSEGSLQDSRLLYSLEQKISEA